MDSLRIHSVKYTKCWLLQQLIVMVAGQCLGPGRVWYGTVLWRLPGRAGGGAGRRKVGTALGMLDIDVI